MLLYHPILSISHAVEGMKNKKVGKSRTVGGKTEMMKKEKCRVIKGKGK